MPCGQKPAVEAEGDRQAPRVIPGRPLGSGRGVEEGDRTAGPTVAIVRPSLEKASEATSAPRPASEPRAAPDPASNSATSPARPSAATAIVSPSGENPERGDRPGRARKLPDRRSRGDVPEDDLAIDPARGRGPSPRGRRPAIGLRRSDLRGSRPRGGSRRRSGGPCRRGRRWRSVWPSGEAARLEPPPGMPGPEGSPAAGRRWSGLGRAGGVEGPADGPEGDAAGLAGILEVAAAESEGAAASQSLTVPS